MQLSDMNKFESNDEMIFLQAFKLHDIVCALWHNVMVSNDTKLCVDFRHNMFATS